MSRPPKYVMVDRETWTRALSLMERLERYLDAHETTKTPLKNLEAEAAAGIHSGNLGPFNKLLEESKGQKE